MTPPVIAFFNNKGGVGKTSLVYHLAWMYADQGRRVVAGDLDPQANLTAAFMDEDRLEELWVKGEHTKTISGALSPLLSGTGDIQQPHVETITHGLGLLVGDLTLAAFEDELSAQWPACLDGKERAFRVVSAFWRLLLQAARRDEADLVLVDVGPNLGAINRAALVAADYVVIPLVPDLFSLQGLRNLGPRLREWRREWQDRAQRNPKPGSLPLPQGGMKPVGYVVQQHSIRLDRPVTAYDQWIRQIPGVYRTAVLGVEPGRGINVSEDPHCLALLKHYRSLLPMAQEHRKPVFHLKPADGAIGALQQGVQRAYRDFEQLAERILTRVQGGSQG